MRITEYDRVSQFADSDVLLLDGNGGTRIISAEDAFFALAEKIAPEAHRTIFRGKNLGVVFTNEQKAAIQNGTFKDLWLGDYWVINGVTWRIVDIDYFYNCSYPNWTTHHLVIMPDTSLYLAAMNSTDTTVGAYYNSAMRKTNLNSAITTANTAFGSANVLSHKEYLANAVTEGTGQVSGVSEYSIKLALPSETQVYGHLIQATPWLTDLAGYAAMYSYDKTQFALFAAHPKFIVDTEVINKLGGWGYWLRDTVGSGQFAVVYYNGTAYYDGASYDAGGVRPYFCVG